MQTIEYIKLSKLKLHPNNPRIIKDEQFKKLCQSIKDNQDYFETRPILCNPDMVIFAGNMRYRAAKEIGLKEVPVAIMDIPEERQRELMIRDNRENGAWDFDLLSSYFETEELIEWGFEAAELFGGVDVVEPEETEGDDDVPVEVEPKTKRGDIYLLGEKHRVMCGDSTMIDDVEKLMDGKKADMVFTDPPYGINYDDRQWEGLRGNGIKSKKFGKIKNDDKNFNPKFILEYFKPKEMFIWGFQYYPEKLGRGGVVAWIKKTEAQKNMLYGDFELCWSKNERNKMFLFPWGGFVNKEKAEGERFHPTQKPIGIIELFFTSWGKNLNIVTDIFLGSGSTLIACEKTNRICYGLELDEHYCDVIVKRYVDFCNKNSREWSVMLNGEDISSEFNNN